MDHLVNVCPGSGPDGFKCPKCPEILPSFEAVSSHYAVCVSVPGVNEPPIEHYDFHHCKYCRKFESNDPAEFERHVPICLDTCDMLFCQKCETAVGNLVAYNLHIEGCYADPPPEFEFPPPAAPVLPPPPPPPTPVDPFDAAPPTEEGPSGSGRRKIRGDKKVKSGNFGQGCKRKNKKK